MRRPSLVVGAIVTTLALLAPGVQAAKKLRVVVTIPDLKSLTEAVGGDLVEVDALTRGTQNFHEAEVRPSMMLKLRRADALVENGAELDLWADVAVLGANNPNIVRGAAGRIEISRGIPLLEVPSTRVDRSMGDVHPLGNPHFSLDPGLAPIITQNIVDGLSRLSADDRPAFEKNRQAFLEKLNREMERWNKVLEPVRGAKVVAYHPDVIYFLTRFGLVQVGTLEDRPGIPPSPQHLVQITRQMKAEGVKVILVEPCNDFKLAQRVAEAAGATAAFLAGYETDTWESYVSGRSATLLGALVLSLTRSRRRHVSQEAVIGVVYAVSSAAAVLLSDRAAHGAEQVRTMLVGNLLAVRPPEVAQVGALYAAIGVFHWLCRRPFFLISTDPDAAFRDGWRVRLWDFLFYASFGVVVTSSVRIAGVLLVFSYLIVPALAGIMFGRTIPSKLLIGWGFGTLVSVLGMVASAALDLPTGATVVCAFGLTLVALSVVFYTLQPASGRLTPSA